MGDTWMVLDATNLAHRAVHTTGRFKHEAVSTGVTYAFLRDMQKWREEFNTTNFVFCFDHGKTLREIKYPWYKHKRRTASKTEEELAKIQTMREQVMQIKSGLFDAIGRKNVFYQEGYEADDLIAAATETVTKKYPNDEVLIVSGDNDVFQLLKTGRVRIYRPHLKSTFTASLFEKEYGIPPVKWVEAKAIAGDPTDGIVGAFKVGPVRACQYLRNQMRAESAAYKTIEEFIQTEKYAQNIEVIRLPYQDTEQPLASVIPQKEPDFDQKQWDDFASSLGMETLTSAYTGKSHRKGTKKKV